MGSVAVLATAPTMNINNIDLSKLDIVLDAHTARCFDGRYHRGAPTLALEVSGVNNSSKGHAFVGRHAPLHGKMVIVAQELRALMSGTYPLSELPSFVFSDRISFVNHWLGNSTHFDDAERFHVDERTGFAFAVNQLGEGDFWRLGEAAPRRRSVRMGQRCLAMFWRDGTKRSSG